QAKLLRVLESRQVLPVGALVPQPIDVRFVAATNRDLRAEVARGAFREDLFFRLAGVKIAIPPLRERPSEIAPLTDEIALAMTTALGRTAPSFATCARECLERYAWPGNVRELRNVVESAVLRSEGGLVRAEDLPEELQFQQKRADASGRHRVRESDEFTSSARAGVPPEQLTSRQREERARILDGLAACNGNQTRAAALLGMPRRTLVYKLAAYAIPRPRI
ncbi:MAG TPA: sigma 54-interacting transcriptional regulator, partial [Polyangiaceae bacterium]|nr:sigma 54-interacting transcriptional regulator [Polyangiaceae bacterium]